MRNPLNPRAPRRTTPNEPLQSRYIIDWRVDAPDLPPLAIYEFPVAVSVRTVDGRYAHVPSTRTVIARTPEAARAHVAARLPPFSRVFSPKGTPRRVHPSRLYRIPVADGTTHVVIHEGADAAARQRALNTQRRREYDNRRRERRRAERGDPHPDPSDRNKV